MFQYVQAGTTEHTTGILFADQVLNQRAWRGIIYECLSSSDRPNSLHYHAAQHIFKNEAEEEILTIGESEVYITGNGDDDIPLKESLHIMRGMTYDHPDVGVESDGAIVTATLENEGGGDLRYLFSGGVALLDCTTVAPCSVVLTAGTDTVPVNNYVYILYSTGLLTASVSGWPATEYAAVLEVLCQSAASLAADGPYKALLWSDHMDATHGTGTGHIGMINAWIRAQPATWLSGIGGTSTGGVNNLTFANLVGEVRQLHVHPFPAHDTGVSDHIHVINDSVTPFNEVSSLHTQTLDSEGVALKAWYTLVIWGVVNCPTSPCKLICNLPSGSYNTNSSNDATDDNDGYNNYDIPAEFKGNGFLISAVTVSVSGTTWTIEQEVDLRGNYPSTHAGGGSGASGLVDIVEDVTPQLGGNLDPNTFGISGGVLNVIGVTTEDNTIAVGVGRTDDGDSQIDLIGDSTYSTYGLRIQRTWSSSGHSVITHRGTGSLINQVEDDGGWQVTINTESIFDCWDTGVWIGPLVQFAEPLYIDERAAAAADDAGYGQLWVKNTTPNELWFTNDAGGGHKVVNWMNATENFLTTGIVAASTGFLSNGDITILETGATTRSLTIGDLRLASGISQINLIGDTTYGTYGTRLIRNAGAGGTSELLHQGASTLKINAETAGGNIGLYTADTLRWYVGDDSFVSLGSMQMLEKAAQLTPAATYGELWVKSDTPNVLIFTDDAGTDHDLTAGGGGGLSDVVDDVTPELGGDLDALNNGIYNVGRLEVSTNAIGSETMLIEANPAASPSWPALVVESQGVFGDDAKIGIRNNYSAAGSLELGQDHGGTGYLWNITNNAYLDFHQNGTLGSMRFYMGGTTLAFRINGDGTTDTVEGAVVGPGVLGTETFLVSQNTAGATSSMAIFESKDTLGALARISIQNRYSGGTPASTTLYQDSNSGFTMQNLASAGTVNINQSGAGNIQLQTNNLVRMAIDGSGDVSVGVVSPAARLHVINTTANLGAIIETDYSFYSRLELRNTYSAGPDYPSIAGFLDHVIVSYGGNPGGTCFIAGDTHVSYYLPLRLQEIAAAPADAAAFGQIWVKNTTPNELWFTDDAGTDVQLGAGGSVSPLTADLDGDGFNLDDMGVLFQREQASADADVTAQGQWWTKTATPNLPMFTDDAGTDHQLIGTEGTFTPFLTDGSFNPSEGQTYISQLGFYTLIGDMVLFTIELQMNSIGSLSTGAYIGGLPFTSEGTYDWSVHVGYASSLSISAETSIAGWIGNSATYITLESWDLTTGHSNMNCTEVSSGGALKLSGMYRRA